MTNRTPFTDRLASALLALMLLGAALSLFVFSFEAARQAAPQPETFLSFPRPVLPRQEPVTVIDARGIPRRVLVPPPQFTPPPAPTAPPAAITLPPPAAAQAPRPGPEGAVNACAPEKLAALTPEERAWCQAPAAPRAKNDLLTSPYQLKDQERFDAEMARKNGTPPPGIPATGGITDPFCKLTVFLLGAGGCGAVAAHHDASDAQVKAAIEAANKRRGAAPPAALVSAKPTGDADAKDTHGGNAAGPGPGAGAAGPGR